MNKSNSTFRPSSDGCDEKTLSRVSSLIDALLDDRTPRKSKRRLQEWFRSPANEELKYDLLEEKFHKLEPNLAPDRYEHEQLKKMQRLLDMRPESSLEIQKRRSTLVPLQWAVRVAAVILPLLTLASVWFWLSYDKEPAYPDTNIAIVADDMEIKHIELPDGSELWINKNSEITYSDKFLEERFLTINGEAYFKVAKDAERPFRVKAKELIVEVTGTEFNIRSFDVDEDAEVVLVEGSVEVETLTKGEKKRYTMTPGDQLKMDRRGHIEIHQLPEQNIEPSWRRPSLQFENVPLREVLQGISTYFQKQILIDANVSHTTLISLHFDNEMNLKQIMDVLESISGAFRYKVEENTIIITAK